MNPTKVSPLRFVILPALAVLWLAGALTLWGADKNPPAASEDRKRSLDYVEKARSQQKDGNYKRAIELYQQALQVKESPEIYYALGQCYQKTGDTERSVAYLEQAVEKQPDYEEAQIELQNVQRL
ncbi:MAG TPA: tetratricopeptide repeat protein, partial [Candidatus Sumerlaeota bacterium]|nr:tetratricopeptide repeat protein [Candidatus Sumerlaeota bacterium]